jgi:hypothetical protein
MNKLVKKRIRKNPNSVRKEENLYFNKNTQIAICAYQRSTDKKERVNIYVREIQPAFQKLVENLINIHKFTSLYDSYDDLKNDCVNFLFETIEKFKPDKGTNAFSYFNVVAKNWLIIKTKQRVNKLKKNISIDDTESLTAIDIAVIEEFNMLPSQDDIIEKLNESQNTIEMLNVIKTKMRTETEKLCMDSIITIFQHTNNLDILSKNAVLTYLRDLSGLTPKQLTTTLQVIKRHYRRIKNEPAN